MALPTRGQPDWDDEMANHISGLEADAQSAKANAEAAISAANNALNVAQAVQGVVVAPVDDALASLLSDATTASSSALSSAVAAQTGVVAESAAALAIANASPGGGLGLTSVQDSRVGVAFSGGYGVTAAGVPYYDTDGATPGEEAVLIPSPTSTSGLSVIKIGG